MIRSRWWPSRSRADAHQRLIVRCRKRVPPKYSESSVMIEVDQVLPVPVVGPSIAAYAAGRAVLLV
jgi:hypothetical protein